MNIKTLSTGLLVFITFLLQGQSVCLPDLELIDSLIRKNGDIYNGTYACYYKNGKLKEKGFIENGMIDSSVYYSKREDLSEIVWYKNNQPERRRLYRKAITTKLIINLKGNVEHGLYERYYLNGQIKERNYYNNGEPEGYWTTWDKKGRLVYSYDYTCDPMIQSFNSYTNNKCKSLIRYVDKKSKKIIKKEKLEKAI